MVLLLQRVLNERPCEVVHVRADAGQGIDDGMAGHEELVEKRVCLHKGRQEEEPRKREKERKSLCLRHILRETFLIEKIAKS